MRTFEERMKRKIEGQLAILNLWIQVIKHERSLNVAGKKTPSDDKPDSIEMTEEHENRRDLLERLFEKRTKLDEALERIPDGVYGICTACGKSIHRQRLETLPEAELCLKCHKLWERFGGLKAGNCLIA